ncbi:MAG: PQQ-binding-like beta-propeller repeat protein [Luteimonas sp.]
MPFRHGYKTFALALLCMLVIPVVVGQARVAMFKGDPQLSGIYDAAPVHSIDGVRFTFRTGGPIRGTPTIAGDTVFVGSGDGNFYAIDAQTGAEHWRFRTGGPISSSAAIANGTAYFASRDGALYAVATADGAKRWEFALGRDLGDQNYWDFYQSSPVIRDGVLYVGSGDGNLYALDAATGRQRWKYFAGSRIRSTPAVTSQLVVFGTMAGHVIALDRADGNRRWDFASQGAANTFADQQNDTTSIFASPSVTDEVVTIGGRDGMLYALDSRSGKLLWKTTHDGSSWILSTAIQDGSVYVGSGSALIVQAASLATGVEQWRFKTDGAVFSSISQAGDTLYFGDFAGNVYALDRANGKQRWRYPLTHRIFSTPVPYADTVFCASDDGVLYALSAATPTVEVVAPTRIVYWEGKANPDAFGWFVDGVDVAIRDFFKNAGYQQLDGAGLEKFMRERIADHARSVVVFADNRIPDSVVDKDSEDAVVRRYLDAGGKIALFGRNPLAYRPDPVSGQVEQVDFSLPAKVFGIAYPPLNSNGGYNVTHTTAEGERWGLHGFGVSIGGAIPPSAVTAVLAADEYGMATAWVKSYGGGEGAGLLQLAPPRTEFTDLAQYRAAVEYGLY